MEKTRRERKTERSSEHEVEPRALLLSAGKSNRSRRLQTRAARLQPCTPGCIRVGVGAPERVSTPMVAALALGTIRFRLSIDACRMFFVRFALVCVSY